MVMSNKINIMGLIVFISSFTVPVGATLKDTNTRATCAYLKDSGLNTRGWKKFFASEYGCSSPYKELGSGFPLKNNLAYYVNGGPEKAKKLKLVLNVNNKEEATLAHHEMLKAANSLLNKAIAKDLPQTIQNAIKEGSNAIGTVYGITIELIRIDWPTGKGYELKLFME